jgi:hypothetical protein
MIWTAHNHTKLHIIPLEDEDNMYLQNVGNHCPSDAGPHNRKLESKTLNNWFAAHTGF